MSMSFQDVPIACSLSDAELRQREQLVLVQFRAAATAIEELPDGYAFSFPGNEKSITLAAELIAAERECCLFLTFELIAQQNKGPVIMRVTGPEGTKEFVRSTFVGAR